MCVCFVLLGGAGAAGGAGGAAGFSSLRAPEAPVAALGRRLHRALLEGLQLGHSQGSAPPQEGLK